MGCTVSVDGNEPSKKNQIITSPIDYKPLKKGDKIRIEMILNYWYDEAEWSPMKHDYYLDLMAKVEDQEDMNTMSIQRK